MTYSTEEVSELLGCHVQTVRRWIQEGLVILEPRRPFLIHGTDLIAFLKKEQEGRRHKCQDHELYCCKCRCPQPAADNLADIKMGKRSMANITALCAVCTTVMNKIVSGKKLTEIQKIFITGTQAKEHRDDNGFPSVHAHFGEGD